MGVSITAAGVHDDATEVERVIAAHGREPGGGLIVLPHHRRPPQKAQRFGQIARIVFLNVMARARDLIHRPSGNRVANSLAASSLTIRLSPPWPVGTV
jgi:hypothetical protein